MVPSPHLHRNAVDARAEPVLGPMWLSATELLDALPDPLFVVDRAWQIVYVNDRALELWRMPRASLIGRNHWEMFPDAVGTPAWRELHRSMATRTPIELETRSVVLGEWIEVRTFPMREGLLVHFREITQRKRQEEELAHVAELARQTAVQATTLQRLTAALSSALSEERVSAIVLEQALPAFNAAAGDVVLLTEDGTEFRALCWIGYPEKFVEPWMRYPIDSGTPAGDVIRGGAPVFMESIAEWERRYPRVAPIIRAHGLSAYAGLPLVFEGKARGVVSFNFPDARTFSAKDRDMLLAFASQCAQALERARLFEAEQGARAEAEAANRAKSDFLAVMSHELRTPLTAIIGYQELLADGVSGPVNEVQLQQLERIKASALHLLQLIEELLTFSRIEAGREAAQAVPVTVASILDEAVTLIAPLAAAKRLTLLTHSPDRPVTITTDPGKLRQVLVNLLSNAVKFTERGTVTLRAAVEGDAVVVTVRDTGIGIPPEHRERIFEPFWQIEQQPTRRVGGTGLGLSVSRALVRLLGGEITVASTVGEGSTFTVRLPVAMGGSPARG